MKIEYIQKCKCGAVTIRFDNNASNSMFWETFEKLDLDTGDATWLHQSYCCDHCVNHISKTSFTQPSCPKQGTI